MNESDVAERDDARWRAIERRDPALAGTFVCGVASTGIYCRPGCPARTPKRENVRFFEAPQAAEAARYRACKRCTPDQAFDHAWPPIARALAAIDAAGDEEAPSLAALAAAAGFSRAQFHRSFVRLVGLTPKRYTSLSRTERTHAGRAAFPGLEVRVGAERSSLGVVVAAMTPRGVCAVELADDEEAGIERVRARFPAARLERDGALDAALAELLRAIDGRAAEARIPLDVAGTAFQRRIWSELARVARGARACTANTVAIAIPCHHFVRSDGGVGGYRWGIERKRRLLEREREAGV